ncbi:PBECR2 nuclease fold domain-containing protein [uncultured Campylobacter sp.]|uniref:LPD3 domain-containing protein n=1 Tax=uncultured Campylobacter sp. TaxID=218934 RepID=UPI00260F5D98|nr:PBECR2 nuclease fold domain-containing protein [uncultured Campylobacter sp.]
MYFDFNAYEAKGGNKEHFLQHVKNSYELENDDFERLENGIKSFNEKNKTNFDLYDYLKYNANNMKFKKKENLDIKTEPEKIEPKDEDFEKYKKDYAKQGFWGDVIDDVKDDIFMVDLFSDDRKKEKDYQQRILGEVKEKISQNLDENSLDEAQKKVLKDKGLSFKDLKKRHEIANKDYKDLSDDEKKIIESENGFLNSTWNNFFNEKDANHKEFKEKYNSEGVILKSLQDKLNTINHFHKKNRLATTILNPSVSDEDNKALQKDYLNSVYEVAKFAGFDDIAQDKNGGLYLIKDDKQKGELAYKVNEGFFDNFLDSLQNSKFEIASSVAGGIKGFNSGKNPRSKVIRGIAGSALGATVGAGADYAVSSYDKDKDFKDMLDYSINSGTLDLAFGTALSTAGHFIERYGVKEALKKPFAMANKALDYTPLVSTTKNFPTQNIKAAQDLVEKSVDLNTQKELDEFYKAYGGRSDLADSKALDALVDTFKVKFGEDSFISKNTQKLNDILNLNSLSAKQNALFEAIRADESGFLLPYVKEVASYDVRAFKNLKNILNLSTQRLESSLKNLNLNKGDIKGILDDLEKGTKEDYNEVMNEILAKTYDDRFKVVLSRSVTPEATSSHNLDSVMTKTQEPKILTPQGEAITPLSQKPSVFLDSTSAEKSLSNADVLNPSLVRSQVPLYSDKEAQTLLRGYKPDANSFASSKQNYNILNLKTQAKDEDFFNERLKIQELLTEQKGEVVNKNTNETAQLSNKGIKKMLSDKAISKSVDNGFSKMEHLQAVANIKTLFENSQKSLIKSDKVDDKLKIYRYKSDFNINDKDAQALITLKEYDENGKKLYSLELDELVPNKLKSRGESLSGNTSNRPHGTPSSASGSEIPTSQNNYTTFRKNLQEQGLDIDRGERNILKLKTDLKDEDFFKQRDKIIKDLKANKGEVINSYTNESAILSNAGIKKMSSDKAIAKSVDNGFSKMEHLEAVANIKELFRNSKKLISKGDVKNSDNNLIINRYVSDLNVNDKEAKALLTLKEYNENGKRFYSLELENLEPLSSTKRGVNGDKGSFFNGDRDTPSFSAQNNYTTFRKNLQEQGLLENMPSFTAPKDLNTKEIEELIKRFDNVENLKKHLNSRPDAKERMTLFSLLDTTMQEPQLKWLKDGKDKRLKKFKNENDSLEPYFYLLVTKDKDKTFITHLKTKDLKYLNKELQNADEILKGADIIEGFRQQAGSANNGISPSTSKNNYTTFRKNLQEQGLLDEEAMKFLNYVENTIYNPKGVTFTQLNNALKNINSFYKQSTNPGFKEHIKNAVESFLREDIKKGINEIFKQDKNLYAKASKLYETSLAEYAQMKELLKASAYKKARNESTTQVKALDELIKYSKGQGKDGLNNLDFLRAKLDEKDIAILEMNLLNRLYEKSLANTDESLRVFDSTSFLNELSSLQNNAFKSKEANEFIELVKGFDKLFKNDAKIALELAPVTAKKEGSALATSAKGAVLQKIVKSGFDLVFRNLGQNVLFGAFKDSIQGAALRYHLKKALQKSDTISEFNNTLRQSLKKGTFNSKTKELSKEFLNEVDKFSKSLDDEINFTMQESKEIPTKTEFKIDENLQAKLNLDTDVLKADLQKLKSTHPELFENKGAVARLINKIKENPTFFFDNNRLDMKLVGAYIKDNFAELGIVTQGKNTGDIGHILETSKAQQRIKSLQNRETKSPLVETATLDTLPYNKADGRNSDISLSKDKDNSTTNVASLSKTRELSKDFLNDVENFSKNLDDEVLKDTKLSDESLKDLPKDLQEQWIKEFNLKSVDDEFVPKLPKEIENIFEGGIHLKLGSLIKLQERDRLEFLKKIKPTLQEPDAVLRQNDGAYIFIKDFKQKKYFSTVTRNENGEWVVTSNAPKTLNNIKNKISEGGELVYNTLPELPIIAKPELPAKALNSEGDVRPNSSTNLSKEQIEQGKPNIKILSKSFIKDDLLNVDEDVSIAVVSKDFIKQNLQRGKTQFRNKENLNVINDIKNNFNPREHFKPSSNFDGLPLLTKDGLVIAGNHRSTALKELNENAKKEYIAKAKEIYGDDVFKGFNENEAFIVRILENNTDENIERLSKLSNDGRLFEEAEKFHSAGAKYKEKLENIVENKSIYQINNEKDLMRYLGSNDIYEAQRALIDFLIPDANEAVKKWEKKNSGDVFFSKMLNDNAIRLLKFKQALSKNKALHDETKDFINLFARAIEGLAQEGEYKGNSDIYKILERYSLPTLDFGTDVGQKHKDLQGDILGFILRYGDTLTNPSDYLANLLQNATKFVNDNVSANIFAPDVKINNYDILETMLKEQITKSEKYQKLKAGAINIRNAENNSNLTNNNLDELRAKQRAYENEKLDDEKLNFSFNSENKHIRSLRDDLKTSLKDNLNVDFTNKQTGIKARISSDELRTMSSSKEVFKSVDNGFKREEYFEVAKNITNIFKNAKLKEKQESELKGNNIKSIYTFEKDIKINGKEAIATIKVFEKEHANNKMNFLRLQELKPAFLKPSAKSAKTADNTQSTATTHPEPANIVKSDKEYSTTNVASLSKTRELSKDFLNDVENFSKNLDEEVLRDTKASDEILKDLPKENINKKVAEIAPSDTTSQKIISKKLEKKEELGTIKERSIKAVDRYAQTQAFKALSKDKQEAILSLKDIVPSPMPQEIKANDLQNLKLHFKGKNDEIQRKELLKLFDITKQKPDIELNIKVNNEDRKEYIKAFQHRENKDLYYIAITQDKDNIYITGIPTTQIKKVINDIAKSEEVLKRGFLEGSINPATPLNENLNKASNVQEYSTTNSIKLQANQHLGTGNTKKVFDLSNKDDMQELKAFFHTHSTDTQEAKELFNRVLEQAQHFKIKVNFTNDLPRGASGEYDKYYLVKILDDYHPEYKAQTLFHELIHSVTTNAIMLVNVRTHLDKTTLLHPKQIEAVNTITTIYKDIKTKFPKFSAVSRNYGMKNEFEFIAELANPEFRDKLKKLNVFEKIVDAITKIVVYLKDSVRGYGKPTGNVYEKTKKALIDIIDNYDKDFLERYHNTYKKEGMSSQAHYNLKLEFKFLNEKGEIDFRALESEAVTLPKALKFSAFKESILQSSNAKPQSNNKVSYKTIIGDININLGYTYSHFFKNGNGKENRFNLTGALTHILDNPLFVTKDKKGAYYFYKPFKDEKGFKHLVSISVDKNGKIEYRTSYEASNTRLKQMIKMHELAYLKE